MTARAAPALTVEMVIEDEGWAGIADDLETLVTRAMIAAHAHASPCDRARASVEITLADDARLRDLNARWRGKDKPTNVLSFPAGDSLGPDGPLFLGDIILARETVEAEALAQGKRVDSHLTHLVVHGMLHLLGFDHETPEEAERMEALEREILLGFGIADPYVLAATHPETTP